MNNVDLLQAEQWELSSLIGYQHSFLTINASTVVSSWIMLLILALVLCLVRFFLRDKESMVRYATLQSIKFFIEMIEQAMGTFSFTHFSFITALFVFIFSCNILSLVPGLEEPTVDLNTTLALGLISFIYTQLATIGAVGLGPYIKSYFSPFFVMLPLNIVGKLTSIISISFRLFGNIFGGSVITTIYFAALERSIIFQFIGIVSGLNILLIGFFTLFEGFLQAFVFTMLTLTYLAMSLQGEGH